MLKMSVILQSCALLLAACASHNAEQTTGENASVPASQNNLYFIGQDLDAIRGYFDSECCSAADGATAYIGLYKVLSHEHEAYGGLGLDPDGAPSDLEGTWGAGPVNAYKTATEFGVDHLGIGLFIAENERAGAIAELNAGEHDDKIRHLAKLFQYVPGKVFLRVGYEFDGNWNQGYADAEAYKTAWRRIVDVLREENATDNVVFVWHGSAAPIDDLLEQRRENIEDWYPGDDYVDWMAISWFLNANTKPTAETDYDPPTPIELASELVDFARERGKPVLIAETAPQAYNLSALTKGNHIALWDGEAGEDRKPVTASQIWDDWYQSLFDFVYANDDVIDAIAYINIDWETQPMWGPPYSSGYWGDTRLEANEEIAAKWNAAIDAWRER